LDKYERKERAYRIKAEYYQFNDETVKIFDDLRSKLEKARTIDDNIY
jgi:hypothetical protein